MSLASSVRRAVKTARRSVRGVEVEVQHEFEISRSSGGRITYHQSELRRAVVEPVIQRYTDAGGSSRVSRATVTFLYQISPPVDPADKITLPSGQTGPILRISEGIADPSNPDGGGFLTELLLG